MSNLISIEQNKAIYKKILDAPKSFINAVLNIAVLEEDEDWKLGDEIFIAITSIVVSREKNSDLEINFIPIERSYIRSYSQLIVNYDGGALLVPDSGDGNSVVLY